MTRPVRRKADASPTLDALARELAVRAVRPGARRSGSATRSATARGVQPGKLHPIGQLNRADAEKMFRTALVRVCGGDAHAVDGGVLWRDADDELFLHVSRAALATGERLIVVSIPLYTDQTGETAVVVPFVTNSRQSALGLIAATETKPRGPAAVIDLFGDALVAAAWAALVEAAAAWAGAAGEAAGHGRLAPAGLAATKAALIVSAQGRFGPEGR